MRLFKASLFVIFVLVSLQSSSQQFVAAWNQNIKNSLNSINQSNSIQVDNEGNCYVLGTTWYTDSAKDVMLIKFDGGGKEIWRRIYDNPSHGDDIPLNMCLDPEGNIWVCGISRLSEENADFLVVKFNPDGIPVADNLFDGKDHLFDCANYIISDKTGNIYVGGYETTLDSGINEVLIRCKPDGSLRWKRTYATVQMDVINQIIVDDSCNAFSIGTINNGPSSADILVQKYDSSGRKKWQLIYDGLLSKKDAGLCISMDDSSYIYVSGFINHISSRADVPLIKVSHGGKIMQDLIHQGKLADCGAVNLKSSDLYITLIGSCNDYNIAQLSYFVTQYEKSGRQKFKIIAPLDVQFVDYDESISPFILGAKLTHPESTLMPYIAAIDSGAISWSFADSTVYGLAHITDMLVKDNAVYFLGDDTGDATGTISVYKYIYVPEADETKEGETDK